MLTLQDIRKSFDHRQILRGISLVLKPGASCLLLGNNGAGKTTLLNVLSGRLKADSGTLSLEQASPNLSENVGVVGHQPMLHVGMSVRENALFFARMLGVPEPRTIVQELAQGLGLVEQLDQEVRFLSRGQLQRAGILRALVGNPKLLLLDEPFTGLDESGRQSLMNLFAKWRSEARIVLFTSHETESALECATRGCLLKQGVLCCDLELDSPAQRDELLAAFRGFSRNLG